MEVIIIIFSITGDDNLIIGEEPLLHPGRCIWGPRLRGVRRGDLTFCPAGPEWAPGWGCLWDGLPEIALMFKLLELCSPVPPNLGEVRHMESREQC